MKSDQQLKMDVTAELAWDPRINATGIGVAVKNGIVTLSGEVDNYLHKHAAERAAQRVSGVRAIALDLHVSLSPGDKRTDAEIAQAALNALKWHSLVPDDSKLKVEVENGWVTLTGELDWGFQSASAEQCIRPLVGVRGVTNQILLKQRASPAEIKVDIEAALTRHAQREAKRIAIQVDGGVVTLRGQVSSMAEHEAAIGTANASKGVTRVVDDLEVVD